MRFRLLLPLCLLFALLAATPGAAQNLLPTGACGLGQYWLVQGTDWDTVWTRQGDSNTFNDQSAFWMQDDTSGTLTIDMEGNSVSVDGVSDPNVWGTLTCKYDGTIRPDGVSVIGTGTCQLDSGTSYALTWSAHIVCGTPEITWSDTAFWHRAAKGHQFSFECPAGGVAKPIWGTDIYIEGSSICTAAVHAGAITMQDGGIVTIEILPGEDSYPGSARNGVTSDTFPTAGQFNGSFRVLGGQSIVTPTAAAVTVDPRVVGAWVSDQGYELDFDSSGTATLVGADPPLTFHVTGVNGQTLSGYAVAENTSGDSSANDCDHEQYGSSLWGDFTMTFDDQYTSFGTTFSVCGLYDSDLGVMHRKGDGQTTQLTPTATGSSVSTGTGWDSFVGTWDTDNGAIELDSSSGVATYNNGASSLYYQQDDSHTISGYWVQTASGETCSTQQDGSNYWGRFRWTFDDQFYSFTGVWGYCDEDPSVAWNGTRLQ